MPLSIATNRGNMNDAEYRDYLKKQSFDDLLAIRNTLDSIAHPDRFALVIAEIEGRDKLTVPPPLPGSELEATWRSSSMPADIGLLTKILLGIGFLCHLASFFMQYAEAHAVLASRLIVALAGVILFVAGCVRLARCMGRSRFYGLFGLLGLIGLAVLFLLPKKSRPSPLQNRT
jgi:hypothetical protein